MDRILFGVGTAASLVFIVAVNWLPWATSNLGTVRYTPDALGPLMTGLAAVVVAFSAAALHRPSRLAEWALIWLSATAAIIAVTVALDAISSANASPYGNTAYGIGSGVGVLAALVMLGVAVARLAVAANDTEAQRDEASARTSST
jgi:hypothetical protein